MSRLALSEELERLLQTEDSHISVGSIVDSVGEKGFGLLLVILSLPSALPVPAAGYSVPFGILLFVLGMQMAIGRSKPVLPQRLRKSQLSRGMAEKMLGGTSWFFSKIERLIKPRMRWIGSRGGRIFMGLLVITMAILMMIPIPLTNTAPAAVVFLIGVGLTEEDGLFAVGACIVGSFAVALYAGLVYAIAFYGMEAADHIKNWIKEQLGRS